MGYIILNQPKKKRRKRGKRREDREYKVHEYDSKKQIKLSVLLGLLFFIMGISVAGLLLYFKFKKEKPKPVEDSKGKEELDLKSPCLFFAPLEFTYQDHVYDYAIANKLPQINNFSIIIEHFLSKNSLGDSNSSIKNKQEIVLLSQPMKLLEVISNNEEEALLEVSLYKLTFDSVFFDTLNNDLYTYKYLLQKEKNDDSKRSPSPLERNDEAKIMLNSAQFYTIKIFQRNYLGKFLLFKLSFKSIVRRFRTRESTNFDLLREITELINLEAKFYYKETFDFLYDIPDLDSAEFEKIDSEIAEAALENIDKNWKF